MEWESDSPCHSHIYPGQERWSPGRYSSWELELRDCGAIPGWGVLLTAERWIEQMWRRISWWEMLVEESQAAMEARGYCWVTRRGWSHHHSLSPPHASISSWTIERLAHQTPDALKYRVGPQPGLPFKCLTQRSTERTPARGAPLCAWRTEPQRRTPDKGAL